MATSGNGLKFTWIPGKKKQNRKGQYSTTKNHHNPYKTSNMGGGSGTRKQEAWSLGGGKGYHQIVNADADKVAEAAVSTAQSALGVAANSAAIVASTSKTDEVIKCETEELVEEKELQEDGARSSLNTSGECDRLDEDEEKHLDRSYHNASTLVLGEKNKRLNASDDLDSIEQLGDSKSNLHDQELDVLDSGFTTNLKTKTRRRRKRYRRETKDEGTVEENDKLIACLYYSLVCCDCTIS